MALVGEPFDEPGDNADRDEAHEQGNAQQPEIELQYRACEAGKRNERDNGQPAFDGDRHREGRFAESWLFTSL